MSWSYSVYPDNREKKEGPLWLRRVMGGDRNSMWPSSSSCVSAPVQHRPLLAGQNLNTVCVCVCVCVALTDLPSTDSCDNCKAAVWKSPPSVKWIESVTSSTFTVLQPHILVALKLSVKTGSPDRTDPLTQTLSPSSPALLRGHHLSRGGEAPARDDRCHCVLALRLQRLHAATRCCLPPNKWDRLHRAVCTERESESRQCSSWPDGQISSSGSSCLLVPLRLRRGTGVRDVTQPGRSRSGARVSSPHTQDKVCHWGDTKQDLSCFSQAPIIHF